MFYYQIYIRLYGKVPVFSLTAWQIQIIFKTLKQLDFFCIPFCCSAGWTCQSLKCFIDKTHIYPGKYTRTKFVKQLSNSDYNIRVTTY